MGVAQQINFKGMIKDQVKLCVVNLGDFADCSDTIGTCGDAMVIQYNWRSVCSDANSPMCPPVLVWLDGDNVSSFLGVGCTSTRYEKHCVMTVMQSGMSNMHFVIFPIQVVCYSMGRGYWTVNKMLSTSGSVRNCVSTIFLQLCKFM